MWGIWIYQRKVLMTLSKLVFWEGKFFKRSNNYKTFYNLTTAVNSSTCSSPLAPLETKLGAYFREDNSRHVVSEISWKSCGLILLSSVQVTIDILRPLFKPTCSFRGEIGRIFRSAVSVQLIHCWAKKDQRRRKKSRRFLMHKSGHKTLD